MAPTQKALLESIPKQLLIAGKWRDSSDGTTIAVEDPSSGATLARVADATVADGKAALDAAASAQADWAKTPPRDRGEILRAAFEQISERADEFAMLMTLEMGKTLAESRVRSSTAPSSSGGSARRPCASTAAGRSRPTVPRVCSP